jgi:uncharacterized membrane protein (UPF0127 family)
MWRKPLMMWSILVATLVIAATAAALFFAYRHSALLSRQAQPKLTMAKAYVNGKRVNVELARTPMEQQKGLSFRPSLGTDEGMLFLFAHAQPQMFWMYGMRFPIDIIFLKNGRVVNVAAHVPANRAVPAVAFSSGAADMVLEVNAGQAEVLGIATGTVLYLEP